MDKEEKNFSSNDLNTHQEAKNLLNDNSQGIQRTEEEDTTCGIGPCTPRWLQKFASKKVYVLVHGLIGMNTFALSSYFIGTISTLEKRFKISSQTSGLITSAWDVGCLVPLIVFSYLGSRGHKTRWMSFGTFLIGISCFLRLIPHFLYGPGDDALKLTQEYGASRKVLEESTKNETTRSTAVLCGADTSPQNCLEGGLNSLGPTVILFLAHLVLGFGTSMHFTLGLSYIDDNARKNKSPVYIAISQSLRMLGPSVGFMMASYALKQYVDPGLTPVIDNKDPRWIGAWWMGWIPIGIFAFLMAFILALFPKQLPLSAERKDEVKKQVDPAQRSLKDFIEAFRRVITNRVLLYNTGSAVFFVIGLSGYWAFFPKYIEMQFRQTASSANFVSGTVSVIFTALGMLTSALVISKFKPSARTLAAWNVLTELFDVLVLVTYAFLSCPIDDLQGSWTSDQTWNPSASCNSGCECGSDVSYAPVCSADGSATFYSACHAGCALSGLVNGTMSYSNCSCISGNSMAVDGACPTDCSINFIIYLVLQGITRFLSATGRAGNTLINIRCVDAIDKSLAIAFSEVVFSALGFIPGPILYGYLLDYACMVWGESCGRSGNCWLYDGQAVRYLLNFTSAGFLLIGTVLDIGVWHSVKKLNIYDDDVEKKIGEVSEDDVPNKESNADVELKTIS